jgi:hypothetical protein
MQFATFPKDTLPIKPRASAQLHHIDPGDDHP